MDYVDSSYQFLWYPVNGGGAAYSGWMIQDSWKYDAGYVYGLNDGSRIYIHQE